MQNLQGKRLLLLGGSSWKEALRKFADQYGVVLAATGNDQSAGIFEIADEKYHINSTHKEEMIKLIRDNHIDGVYMGGSEPVIASACEYLEELHMPCYCTKTQWEYLQNKENFKNLCKKFDLPVVCQYKLDEDTFESDIKAVEYPVITKPTDGCGSNGFSVCHNESELRKGYAFAAENSESGSVLVEKFVKNEAIGVFYTFSNGKMYFSGSEDKYPIRYKENGSYVGGMYIFESRAEKEFRKLFEEKLQKMFASIGIKEGSIWIEVFHSDNAYYFNEVGYRYGGTISVYPVNYMSEINQVYADMYYALTGESCIHGYESLVPQEIGRHSRYCVYPIFGQTGKIHRIEGLSAVSDMPGVVKVFVAKDVGAVVPDTGSFTQIVALVHFTFDGLPALQDTVQNIQHTLQFLNENNENMIYRKLPTGIVL